MLTFCISCRLLEEDRFRHLSLICRRQDKYGCNDISEQTWTALVSANPQLSVTLRFDHTCPLWRLRQVLKPQMPLRNLFLETYTPVVDELALVAAQYGATLRKLVVQTQSSVALDLTLLTLARAAPRLRSLHVMCTVARQTVDELHKLLPEMQAGDCTLKSRVEPCPWVQDRILDKLCIGDD